MRLELVLIEDAHDGVGMVDIVLNHKYLLARIQKLLLWITLGVQLLTELRLGKISWIYIGLTNSCMAGLRFCFTHNLAILDIARLFLYKI